jgi:hypothetical protein
MKKAWVLLFEKKGKLSRFKIAVGERIDMKKISFRTGRPREE